MKITFAPRGIVQVDNCRIIFRNFSGEASQYNRAGDRNFGLVIEDEDIKDALLEEGWNVKIKPPREEWETPLMYLPVKVKFNDRGPNVYLVSGRRRVKLDEDSISMLDNVDILSVDLDIRPYNWAINGKTGKTAYLHSMQVIQECDRFSDFMEE